MTKPTPNVVTNLSSSSPLFVHLKIMVLIIVHFVGQGDNMGSSAGSEGVQAEDEDRRYLRERQCLYQRAYWTLVQKLEEEDREVWCLSDMGFCQQHRPPSSEKTVLEEDEVMKIDMRCHIDGFIAVVAHSHYFKRGPVTGRADDVIAKTNTTAEVALRLVRHRKKFILGARLWSTAGLS